MHSLCYTGPDKRAGLCLLDYLRSSSRRRALPWTGLASLKLTPYTLYDVYRHPERQCALAAAMEARCGADFTGIMDDGIICSETLGMRIRAFDTDFPAVEDHPICHREALARLRVPDPFAAGRMPVNLAALKRVAEHSPRLVAISVEGPFTLAGQLAGVAHLARLLIQDPGFAKELLAFTTATVKAYAQAACQAGADLVSIAEPTAIILSPEQFAVHVAPNLRDILHDLSAWKAVHICGDTTHLLPQMLTIGVEALSLDQVMDIPALLATVPGEIVLFGNIDPLYTMLEMPVDGVRRETTRLLEQVAAYPNFLMSTGCDCPLATPLENIRCLVDTTHGFRQPRHQPTRPTQSLQPVPVPAETLPSTSASNDKTDVRVPQTILSIREAVVHFEPQACIRYCRQAVDEHLPISDAIQQGLAAGMQAVGERFSQGRYFIPELILCADALYAGLDILKPMLTLEKGVTAGRMLIGVIQGDVHEIGKNLVKAMLDAAGWEMLDLGVDVSAQRFVDACESFKPDVVGISALMTTSMMRIPTAIECLKDHFPEVRVIVGGAPLNAEQARRFGADGYAEDAVQAVVKCSQWVERQDQAFPPKG